MVGREEEGKQDTEREGEVTGGGGGRGFTEGESRDVSKDR